MSGTITPLCPKGGPPSLARIDLVAVALLAEGRAKNLQAARIAAILADLREQRSDLAAVLADLRGREPSGDAQADAANAKLVDTINQGIVQLDLFIARAQVHLKTLA